MKDRFTVEETTHAFQLGEAFLVLVKQEAMKNIDRINELIIQQPAAFGPLSFDPDGPITGVEPTLYMKLGDQPFALRFQPVTREEWDAYMEDEQRMLRERNG